MLEVRKDEKGFYRLEKGKYRRKLVEYICVMCGGKRYKRPGRHRDHCRKCAYIVNAFKINNYIKRPGRNSKGQYTKGEGNDESKSLHEQ